MKYFFTADTLFGSESVIDQYKQPFDSAQHRDREIIKRWNAVVDKDDHIYHLGDFGNPEVILQLNGKKFMVQGNYDDAETVRYMRKYVGFLPRGHLVRFPSIENYGDFLKIDDGYEVVEIGDVPMMTLQLVHEPSHAQPLSDSFVLFAHIHKTQMVKLNGLNVGVDCHNFTPIDLSEVIFWRNAIKNHYDDEVFLPGVGI